MDNNRPALELARTAPAPALPVRKVRSIPVNDDLLLRVLVAGTAVPQ